MNEENTMKEIPYRKYCICFLSFSAAALLAAALLVVLADPFFQYHKPLAGLFYQVDNKLNQNPGMARHFDYDSVIVGSSMTINFDTELFRQKMGLDTIKLSYDGAYPKDVDTIMKIVEESDRSLSAVFLDIDIYTYKNAPGLTAYEIPAYLYDQNPLNDIPYLLNKEVILQYIIRPQVERESTPINEIYWTWPVMYYGKEFVAQTYHAPTEFLPSIAADSYSQNISDNLDNCIIPHIESMPDTEFYVFFPPYSILYWYDRYADGTLSAELSGIGQIVETLSAYPNVKLFYFQDQFDYIKDLAHYTDYTHYNHDMNDFITECFAEDRCRITKENCAEILDTMYRYLSSCDFEQYVP